MREGDYVPNLEIHGVPLGKRQRPRSLVRWLYVGGAGTNLYRLAASIDSGSLGAPLLERVELLLRIREAIQSRVDRGESAVTIRGCFIKLNIFFKWIDDGFHDLSMDNVVHKYIQWAEDLVYRATIEKSLARSSAYVTGGALGQILDQALGRDARVVDQTRLIDLLDGRRKFRGVLADKQNLEATFTFGRFMQDICDGLSIDVLWGPVPARIPLRNGRELLHHCGRSGQHTSGLKRNSKRARDRHAAFENDKTLRTRHALANLRVLAELLMFIAQTGMNLAQAHRLSLRNFSYASDMEGYKVRDYKRRRGGEVLFEIYREYRSHFERYLDWRRTVFPGQTKLFPLVRRGAHEDVEPSFKPIKLACAEIGIDWVPPRMLRNTRVNWLLRRSGDVDLTAEMAQHSKQTLLRVYEVPSQQVAITEITRFWKDADPHLASSIPIRSLTSGACDGEPEAVPFKPRSAPDPDCVHTSGCLWCDHHRDIDSFDYVWALACFRHLKTIEVAKYCPPVGSTTEHPAGHAVDHISKKLAWFRDSSAVHADWVDEAVARVEEGYYHPEWARPIDEIEGGA